MKDRVRTAAAAAAITVSSLIGSVEPARAYPVDCAILLCLAGGWPASAPCAHARAVFIRRITPWPIEPPLQIWRCPMGASFNAPAPSPKDRLHDIVFREVPQVSVPTTPLPLLRVQSDQGADIDISGDAFDFVRSIRVFHVRFDQHATSDGACVREDLTRLGTYGLQGAYRWARSNVGAVPAESDLPPSFGCAPISYRSVFVDWRDHEGNYGFEEVRY
jgi:hypothetical protein